MILPAILINMKIYLSDLLPKIQRFSKKLDNLTILTNQNWVLVEKIGESKVVFIFRDNNELLISKNGLVEKAEWQYLGNNSLLIDGKSESYIYKHGFIDENILALKIDDKEDYSVFINEAKFTKEINSIQEVSDFLYTKYLKFKPDHKQLKHLVEGIDYEIIKENQYWDLFKGQVIEFFLSFEDKEIRDPFIYNPRKNKFGFFIGNKWMYFNEKEECVNNFYMFLKQK